MLNFFRRKDAAARYLLGGILVIICFAMVMFLIPGFGGGNTGQPGNETTLASVGGRDVSVADFNNEMSRLQQTQRLPPQFIATLGRSVLDNLVMQDALAAEAQQLGFSASPLEIAHTIRQQIPELFPNGQFIGDARYADFVQQTQQMSVPQFEQRVRDEVVVRKLYDLVTDGVRVSDAEVRGEFERRNAKAVFQYVVVKPADLAAQVSVTPPVLQAYYQANQAKYLAPERRTLALLIADVNQFAARVQVSPQDAQQNYQANIATYTFPERVQLAHILFKTAGDSAADIAKVKQQATAALQKLRSGAKFADIAKQQSQDDASAGQGGELGWITRGRMFPAVEQVAFSLPPGQISEVTQTPYGFEIIKVEAHQAAHVEPLAQVQDAITQQLKRQQGLDQAQRALDQARLEASATPLPQLARKYGLQFFTTPPVSRTDPITGIGISAEFENDVFDEGLNGITPTVKVPSGFALAKVTAIQPPAIQPLSAVRDQVERDYRQQQALVLAADDAAALQKKALSVGLKAAAAAMHLQVATSPTLASDGALPDVGSIAAFAPRLFALKPGQVGPVAKLPDNNSELVYALVGIQQPPATDFAQQQATVRDALLQEKQQSAFQAFEDHLRDQLLRTGKIKINDTLLKATLGSMTEGS